MKRYKTVGLLIATALLTNVAVASAQRWGREGTPGAGVCFYEHVNFDGRYFCTTAGATTAEVPSGTNDEISSVRLFGNAAVTVFREPGFRGQSTVIDSSIADLRGMGFNDRISSYRVDTSRGPNRGGPPNRGGTAVLRDQGQSNGSRLSQREAETIVRRSYRSVLERDPDASGLRSWTEQVLANNWTQRDLENALRRSDEYRALQRNRRR
jgi:hypothetical protein